MTILVTGGHGQLGSELSDVLPNAIYAGSKDLDITKWSDVQNFVKQNNIDTIINCAAYTNVDGAESDQYRAKQINAFGPRNLVETNCNLIHVSTDYVFDGNISRPYNEKDMPNPKSVYGYTKMLGEREVLFAKQPAIVIRTSWLYSKYGKNFLKTMQRLGAEKSQINVVNDQIGNPTYAADLARAIVDIIPQMNLKNKGIYHFSNEGACSWYAFACEIMKLSGLNCVVNPIPSSQYPTIARRPFYSALDKTKIKDVFGIKIDTWQNALNRCINENSK